MEEVRGIIYNWDYSIGGTITGNLSPEGESIETTPIKHFSGNGRFVHTQDGVYELSPPLNIPKQTPHSHVSDRYLRRSQGEITILSLNKESGNE